MKGRRAEVPFLVTPTLQRHWPGWERTGGSCRACKVTVLLTLRRALPTAERNLLECSSWSKMGERATESANATSRNVQLVRRLRNLFLTARDLMVPAGDAHPRTAQALARPSNEQTGADATSLQGAEPVATLEKRDGIKRSPSWSSPILRGERERFYDRVRDTDTNSRDESFGGQAPRVASAPPIVEVHETERVSIPDESCRARVILLCGLPGSGKSTFAKLLLERGGDAWQRISQDELGSRQECERLMQEALTTYPPRHVVIDRCNVDCGQRAFWIGAAARANAYPVGIVVFSVSMDECIRRVQRRGPDHPTLVESSDSDIVKVITSFASKWQNPSAAEGIAFCRVIQSAEDVERVLAELV